MQKAEIHDFDLDGEDIFPEYVEQGVALLQRGEVTFTDFDGRETEEVTERIEYPNDAAYFTLRSRGLRSEDVLTTERRLVTALAIAIEDQLPYWNVLRVRLPREEPTLYDYKSYRVPNR